MAHRPQHPPDELWVWSQHWLDLLFLHWQVPAAALRPHVPAPLEIETFDERAWVSLVLFRLRVRPRWLPFVPGLSGLLEVNLRTYVRFRDQPGIWFLSVHADNSLAIRLARWLTPMPYRRADMRYRRQGGFFHFQTRHPSSAGCRLSLSFQPDEESAETVDDTLDAWLLERYRLFVPGRLGGLMQAEVTHPRWIIHGVDLIVAANSLGQSLRLDLPRLPDRAHFSAGVRAHFGAFRPLTAQTSEVFA